MFYSLIMNMINRSRIVEFKNPNTNEFIASFQLVGDQGKFRLISINTNDTASNTTKDMVGILQEYEEQENCCAEYGTDLNDAVSAMLVECEYYFFNELCFREAK